MLVALTIIRYSKSRIPLAFLAMAMHRLPLSLNRRCNFWKLMGSGKNGTFDKEADLQQWALLSVWNNETDFNEFSQRSFISLWWKKFAAETYTILCEPLISHGLWDGKEPFGKPHNTSYTGPIAVLTRATIRFNRLKNFWANVDKVAKLMSRSKGYITSFGIGEAPLYRQATFSIWESVEDVKAFAYQSEEHREVIQKTRDENWYSEELFARFKPIASFGTLNGKDPIAHIFKTYE
jgi:heme-degrading monooxygenase HmoA